MIRAFLAENNTNTIQQAPNSPDLALCDFFLFGRLKKSLRGSSSGSRETITEKSLSTLNVIPEVEFRNCYEDWIKRWHKCVAVNGAYVEGDNIDLDE